MQVIFSIVVYLTRIIICLIMKLYFIIQVCMRNIGLRINQWLEANMPFLTPLGVVIGFLFPSVCKTFRPAIPFLFGIMTLSSAFNLHFRELVSVFTKTKLLVIFFINAHIIMPLVSFIFSKLNNPYNPSYIAGFVLLFSTPTAVSGFIWNTIYKGNNALSLSIIVLDTILSPLVVPLTIYLLIGTSISISLIDMSFSLILMIVIPTVLGIGINDSSHGQIPNCINPIVKPISKLCLILVVAANSAVLAPQVQWSELTVYWIGFQAIVLGMFGFFLGDIAGKWERVSQPEKTTFILSIGLRNISAAATLAIAFFPPAAALPAILGMIFQQSLASFAGAFFIKRKACYNAS